jgi:DNA-directed RNA polymerase subunit RPC12/RpoP
MTVIYNKKMGYGSGSKDREFIIRKWLEEFAESCDSDYTAYQLLHPWKTERWEQRRKEVVSDVCSHCGSGEDLQVHHTNHGCNWRDLMIDVRNELYIRDGEHDVDGDGDVLAVCPDCGYSSYNERKTKTPKYKCSECKNEFSQLLNIPNRDVEKAEYMVCLWGWTIENKNHILESFEAEFWEYWEQYFTTDDVVTLCRGCHDEMHYG